MTRHCAAYTVRAGDSYWSIAEAELGDRAAGGDVHRYVEALMAANAAALGYDIAAMLHPGDVLSLPAVTEPTAAPAGDDAPQVNGVPSHLVAAGDSYWSIAEATLGADATPARRRPFTNDLIDLNNPILAAGDPSGARNYDIRPMIHPGDIVYLLDPATLAPPSTEPAPALPPPSPPVVEPAAEPSAAEIDTPPPTSSTLPPPTTVPAAASDDGPTATPRAAAASGGDESSSVMARVRGGIAGLTTLTAAGVAAMFVARRRRGSRAGPISVQRPCPPACTPTPANWSPVTSPTSPGSASSCVGWRTTARSRCVPR